MYLQPLTYFLFFDNAFIISKSESIFLAQHQGHFPTGSAFFLALLQEGIPGITEFYYTYRKILRDIPKLLIIPFITVYMKLNL